MFLNKKFGYVLTIIGMLMVIAGATTLVHANEPEETAISSKETTIAEPVELMAEVIESPVEVETPVVASTVPSSKQQKSQQPSGVRKGEQFVNYIVNKFDFSRKSISLVSRNEGAGDTPDLVINLKVKGKDYRFAVECVWRNSMPKDELTWASEEKMDKIEKYIRSHKTKTFIVIGIGGTHSAPQKLYIVPFDERPYRNLYTSVLEKYRCQSVSGKFFYEPDTHNLTIK